MQLNTELTALLAQYGTTKLSYSNTIISALGATRRIVASKDGTVFFDAALTGSMSTIGGNISSVGIVGDTAVHTGADISTGVCKVRITGSGNYLEGTLGLSKETQIKRSLLAGKTLEQANAAVIEYEFTLTGNPTTLNGIGILNSMRIKAPEFLPSGTGPAAPDLDADAPAYYQMFSYPDTNEESNRVALGVKAINVRDSDMVFERDFIAKQIGDVRVMRSAAGDGTVFGTGGDCFRFAPTMLVSNKSTNATNATKPVYRIRFLATPHGRWGSFPYRPDFNITVDTLSPQAFKIELYRADMTLIDVIEMYSTRVNDVPGTGKPVNGHDQYCVDSATTVNPAFAVQPWWTCQMSLSWQSARYKPSIYLNTLHPGVEDQVLDPTNVIEYDAWPDDWPVLTGNNHSNGLMAVRVAPKWSRKLGSGYDTTIVDTKFQGGWRDDFRTQLIGFGYEPGSTCQHVWYMSPGGSRHERGMWPHYTVAWITNQNGVRVHGDVPYSELQHNFNLGYHNEGCHYVTNPELGKTLEKDHVIYGLDCYNDTYYNGGSEAYRPATNAIRLLTQANAVHNNPFRDKNGRQFVCEYQRDVQHNISDAAMMTYFNNDPMGALEARDSLNSSMLCAWDQTRGFSASDYMKRQHAWQFKHFVENWIVANNNPNGMSSAEIEFMVTNHLNQVYNAVNPYMNSGTIEGNALRDLGTTVDLYYSADKTTGSAAAYDSKQFYFGSIFMLAKQSGFWDRIRSIDAKNALALDMMIKSLCKASIDFFVDGNGRYDRGSNKFMPFTTATPPTSWSWNMIPADSNLDWLHQPDGRIGSLDDKGNPDGSYPEGFNTQHYRAQFLWIMKYFYPEVNQPRLDQAITKVRGWYDEIEARKNAGGQNWHWRFSMMGIPKAPAKVGPPTI